MTKNLFSRRETSKPSARLLKLRQAKQLTTLFEKQLNSILPKPPPPEESQRESNSIRNAAKVLLREVVKHWVKIPLLRLKLKLASLLLNHSTKRLWERWWKPSPK